MQVKKDLPLYVGGGGWMEGEWVLVWLNPSERWSGSAKMLPVSQHNVSPFEFHPLQSLTKAGDTVQFY